jgi:hypothetical protein
MAAEASLLAPVIVVAALVVKTALLELRHPGSARQGCAFRSPSGGWCSPPSPS